MVDVSVDFVLENDEPIQADFELEPDVTYTADIMLSSASSFHNELYNRDLPDQHPMSAITGLESAIEGLSEDIIAENNRAIEAEEILDNKIDSETDTRIEEITRVEGLISAEETRAERVEQTKVDKVDSANRVYGTDSQGNQTTYDKGSFGQVDDVQVGGVSVVTNKVAELGTMAGETASDYSTTAVADTLYANISYEETINNHIADKDNPHEVTKAQVGLGNCDNTSDLDKPISTATQEALDSKQATISDLSTIRENATHGESAYNTISGYGDIVTHNTNEFATAAQGSLADTAVQPNDLATVATSGSYNDLSNKPTIGNATLTIQKNGDNVDTFTANATSDKVINITVPTTASDVGALPDTTTINDLTTTAQQNALNSGATSTNIGQIATNTASINTINDKIPAQASSSNQLADKNFVNSSIATNRANFIGTFANVTALESYVGTVTNNDYAFVINSVVEENGGDWASFSDLDNYDKSLLTNVDYAWVINGSNFDLYRFDIVLQTWELRASNIEKSSVTLNRAFNEYKATDNGGVISWEYEYTLNNSSFTATQWAAINSGITSGDVALIQTAIQPSDLATVATSGSYNDLSNKPTIGNATLTIQKNGTTVDTFTANSTSNKTINLTVPTATSDLTNDSGFITSAQLDTKQDKLTSANAGTDISIVSEILPSAYKRVTGFTMNNDCYFEITGFHLKGSDTLRFSITPKAGAINVLGCYTSSSATDNYSLYVGLGVSNKYLRYNGGTYSSQIVANTKYDVVITPTGATGLEQSSTWTAQTFTSVADFCIGTTSSSTTSSKFMGTFHGEIVVDGRARFIPCERLSDNVLGYYEYESGTFYTPAVGTPVSTGYDNVPALTISFTNDSGFITGITSGDVTTALGYTPYNSSNPNGYTPNVGTVTSVNNVSPDSNGNVTLAGVTVDQTYDATSANAQSGVAIAGALGDYVTTNTTQSITGVKTLTNALNVDIHGTDARMAAKFEDISLGTSPSADYFAGFTAQDSNGTYYASADCIYRPDGTVGSNLWAKQNGVEGFLGVYVSDSGNVYTRAPTPATSDNSTKIATTAYVKAQGYAVDSGLVHTTGNETIGGIKTFSSAAKFAAYNGIIILGTDHYYQMRSSGGTPEGCGLFLDNDTSKVAFSAGISSITIGSANITPLSVTPATSDNSTKIATTAFVNNWVTANTSNVHVVVETYKSGSSWYRVYDDGWIEQGGWKSGFSSANTFENVTLHKPFADTYYNVQVSGGGSATTIYNYKIGNSATNTTTAFKLLASNTGAACFWYACGMGA